MIYKAKILVTLKEEVKDAKGQVLEQIIKRKEYAKEPICHTGKFYSVEFESENAGTAKLTAVKTANDILANTVIEQYEILSVEEVSKERDENVKSRNCCLSGN